jgi:hypothetical protein
MGEAGDGAENCRHSVNWVARALGASEKCFRNNH